MSGRHSDRERWESLLLIILLATRPFLFFGGLILLIYALVSMAGYPAAGWIALILAIFLFSLVFSDLATQLFARFGAWLATLGRG